MRKIAGILVRERIRRIGNAIRQKTIASISIALLIPYLIYCIPDTVLFLAGGYVKYVVMLGNIYLLMKIINRTQGMKVDYQLIQLKLITLNNFKFLIAIKSYGVGVLATLILCIFRGSFTGEDWNQLMIFLMLNCTVNVYTFLKSRYSYYILDFVMAVLCCISIYWKILPLTVIMLLVVSIIFIKLKQMNYEELIPLYRLMYQVGQMLMGTSAGSADNKELQKETEMLFGKKKIKHNKWCEYSYENKSRFFRRKEIARILANRDKVVQYMVILLIISIGVFYLPKWYQYLAWCILYVMINSFCYSMCEPEKKLYKYGLVADDKIGSILKEKWMVYSVLGIIMLIPSVAVFGRFFWLMPLISIVAAFMGIVQCFGKVIFAMCRHAIVKRC